jgi:protein TonB
VAVLGVLWVHALVFAAFVEAKRPASAQVFGAIQVVLAAPRAQQHDRPPRQPEPQLAPPPVAVIPVISLNLAAPPDAILSRAPEPTAMPAAPTIDRPVASADLGVQCPDRQPPHYPAQSRREREQGEVVLRVLIDDTGHIGSVTIVRSSGSRRLDEAARTAVESWHCSPAQRDGHNVPAAALQTLAFELRRE